MVDELAGCQLDCEEMPSDPSGSMVDMGDERQIDGILCESRERSLEVLKVCRSSYPTHKSYQFLKLPRLTIASITLREYSVNALRANCTQIILVHSNEFERMRELLS